MQAVALAPAILLAPLVLALFEPRGLRSTVSRYRWLYGIVLAAVGGVLVVQLASGGLLGAYEPVGERSYDVGEALRYLWWHVAELSLYVLVVPLAATIVLVARARTLDQRLQEFLAATVSVTVCMVPIVAVFASRFSDRIEERNMFYVAPLLCIVLLAWVERGAPRPRLLAAVAAVVSALLVVAIPFDRFLTTSAITDTLMLLPLWSLQDRIGDDWIRLAALGLAAGLAAAFLFVPTAVRGGPAASRPRPLDPRDPTDLVGDARIRALFPRRALPGDSRQPTATGSTTRSRRARRPRSSGRAGPTASP